MTVPRTVPRSLPRALNDASPLFRFQWTAIWSCLGTLWQLSLRRVLLPSWNSSYPLVPVSLLVHRPHCTICSFSAHWGLDRLYDNVSKIFRLVVQMKELNGCGGSSSPLTAPLCCKTEASVLFEILPLSACPLSTWSPSPICVNSETPLDSSSFLCFAWSEDSASLVKVAR